jgi:cysteine-rich repeat protein
MARPLLALAALLLTACGATTPPVNLKPDGGDARSFCGDGVADPALGETCDTALASGPGACPTGCDDGVACTTDTLSNPGTCQALCEHTDIRAATDGDGCCPAGEDETTDNDCAPRCGDGVVEGGEACDTGIPSGPGACPTSCDDGQTCTADTLNDAGTCQAACGNTAITRPADGDGCCPAGASPTTDDDCAPGCGDGVVDGTETCDTAIASGPGACPTSCDDGLACTTDALTLGGSCQAACTQTAITTPVDGDTCCPAGANANEDSDCAPVCGNGVTEAPEQCDDAGTVPGDGCSASCELEPTAFRFDSLALRDPHVFVNFISCNDVTDTPLAGFSLNGELTTHLTTDGDSDGLLDLSPTLVFRPLRQTEASVTPMDVTFADCTAPLAGTQCSPGAAPPTPVTATSQLSGTCLAPPAGTTSGWTPAVAEVSGACFVSSESDLSLSLGGTLVPLTHARVAAAYDASPATHLTTGLLQGFLSESTADLIQVPVPLLGNQPLSSLLPGGTGSCDATAAKDTVDGVTGWWFYLNFTASPVPWTEP